MDSFISPKAEFNVDNLSITVYDNRLQMGKAAAYDVAHKMKELLEHQETVRMVFAAAPSQNEFLETLTGVSGIDWSRITVFQMDEYVGLSAQAKQLFSKYLSSQLFDIVKPGEVQLINSENNPVEECKRYAALLSEKPIDIVCMGIGENGHIAFNDPPVADFSDPLMMKKVELDRICRQQQVNDGCFATIEDVPQFAVTLTIPGLTQGRFLYCIVPGERKGEAVKNTLYGPIDKSCPASILRKHDHCRMYVDAEAFFKAENFST